MISPFGMDYFGPAGFWCWIETDKAEFFDRVAERLSEIDIDNSVEEAE